MEEDVLRQKEVVSVTFDTTSAVIRLGLALGSAGDAFRAKRVKEPLGESLKRKTRGCVKSNRHGLF